MRGYILVFIGVAVFATSLPLSSVAVAGFDGVTAGLGRALGGAICSGLTLLALRPALPKGRQWRHLAYCGVGTGFIFPTFTALGMTDVGANDGAVVIAILPLSTAIFARFVEPDRKLSPWFWTGSILACVLVAAFILRDGFGGFSWGYIYLLFSLLVGFSYAWSARVAREVPAWQVICWGSLMALPIQVLIFAFIWPWLDLEAGWQAWLGLGLGVIGPQWAGFFAFYAGLALVGGARGSLVQYSQPFLTFAFVAAIGMGTLDPQVLIYILAVLAALSLTRIGAK